MIGFLDIIFMWKALHCGLEQFKGWNVKLHLSLVSKMLLKSV